MLSADLDKISETNDLSFFISSIFLLFSSRISSTILLISLPVSCTLVFFSFNKFSTRFKELREYLSACYAVGCLQDYLPNSMNDFVNGNTKELSKDFVNFDKVKVLRRCINSRDPKCMR